MCGHTDLTVAVVNALHRRPRRALALTGAAGDDDLVRRFPASATAIAALLVAGCTASPASEDAAPDPPAKPAATTAPAATPTPTADPAPHPVSLPALMQRRYDGRNLRLGRVLDANDAYTEVLGLLPRRRVAHHRRALLPTGEGPFPALVLNHGYIDPDVYVTGQGLQIEQAYLARSGFVVLHADYRNHAGSDDDPKNGLRLRLGYTEDTINAVKALRRSGLPQVDPDRIGMLGRSMGGGVTLNALVVRPRLVDAAVIYSSVSSATFDNHRKWTRPGRPNLQHASSAATGRRNRTPSSGGASPPAPTSSGSDVPVLVHHGTADATCPVEWADATVRALKRADADVTYLRYPGEGHAFSSAWQTSMRRTVKFFNKNLSTGWILGLPSPARRRAQTRADRGPDRHPVEPCTTRLPAAPGRQTEAFSGFHGLVGRYRLTGWPVCVVRRNSSGYQGTRSGQGEPTDEHPRTECVVSTTCETESMAPQIPYTSADGAACAMRASPAVRQKGLDHHPDGIGVAMAGAYAEPAVGHPLISPARDPPAQSVRRQEHERDRRLPSEEITQSTATRPGVRRHSVELPLSVHFGTTLSHFRQIPCARGCQALVTPTG